MLKLIKKNPKQLKIILKKLKVGNPCKSFISRIQGNSKELKIIQYNSKNSRWIQGNSNINSEVYNCVPEFSDD